MTPIGALALVALVGSSILWPLLAIMIYNDIVAPTEADLVFFIFAVLATEGVLLYLLITIIKEYFQYKKQYFTVSDYQLDINHKGKSYSMKFREIKSFTFLIKETKSDTGMDKIPIYYDISLYNAETLKIYLGSYKNSTVFDMNDYLASRLDNRFEKIYQTKPSSNPRNN